MTNSNVEKTRAIERILLDGFYINKNVDGEYFANDWMDDVTDEFKQAEAKLEALMEAEVKRKLSEHRFGGFSDKGLEEYLSDLEYEKQRRAALTQEKNNG